MAIVPQSTKLRAALDALTPDQRNELRQALYTYDAPAKNWNWPALILFLCGAVACIAAILFIPSIDQGLAVLLAIGCALLFIPVAPRARENRTERIYWLWGMRFYGDEETDALYPQTAETDRGFDGGARHD